MYKLPARPVHSNVAFVGSDFESKRNVVWRFYTDASHQWMWQRLSVQGDVISQSTRSHADYDGCLSDAADSGYVFQPSQPRKAPTQARHAQASGL